MVVLTHHLSCDVEQLLEWPVKDGTRALEVGATQRARCPRATCKHPLQTHATERVRTRAQRVRVHVLSPTDGALELAFGQFKGCFLGGLTLLLAHQAKAIQWTKERLNVGHGVPVESTDYVTVNSQVGYNNLLLLLERTVLVFLHSIRSLRPARGAYMFRSTSSMASLGRSHGSLFEKMNSACIFAAWRTSTSRSTSREATRLRRLRILFSSWST